MAHGQFIRNLLPLLPLAALAACSPGDNDPGPGGVTAGEARALDDAAAMLEQRRLPEAALQPQSAAPTASPSPEIQPTTAAATATTGTAPN